MISDIIEKEDEMQKISDALKRFNIIVTEIDNCYHMAALKMGVSDSVMEILYVMYSWEDGCKQSDIYKSTGTSKQTVNSAIKKMEREGLLKVKNGQGRNTIILLTEEGKKLQNQCVKPMVDAENEIFDSWTKEEREEFLRLNTLYLEGIKQRIESWENLEKKK